MSRTRTRSALLVGLLLAFVSPAAADVLYLLSLQGYLRAVDPCSTAFFVGPCGVASCHHDAEAGSCRPCRRDDPGRCENTCGAFEGPQGPRRCSS
ncbi:MAG TPA: hypothetical protein VNO26_14740 [Candidatus Limnocylindria bacterium]|nr:hypothetical protein [Candidatus Limnocylindria bacterium]